MLDGRTNPASIYGEQRGLQSDFTLDGRTGVTQNGALTPLPQPRSQARMRVKVNAGSANPPAGRRCGWCLPMAPRARTTITAGSGYWSQDSATQVLGYKKPVQHLESAGPMVNNPKPVKKTKEITVERDSKTAAR